MKYAIIENEGFARLSLQKIVSSLRSDFELCFTAETVADSVAMINEHPDIDLIFMDIELDDGICFDIFMQTEVKVPVIFTTAYDEYAVKAFKVDSIDYLLKPIQVKDVQKAIGRFEERRSMRNDYRKFAYNYMSAKARTRILVNRGEDYIFVNIEDIAWFEAEDKYVTIVFKTGESMLTNLPSLEVTYQELDANRFFRISRSVLASIESITRVTKHFKGRLQVELKAAETVRKETVSAPRRQSFLSWLGQM